MDRCAGLHWPAMGGEELMGLCVGGVDGGGREFFVLTSIRHSVLVPA